MGRIVYSRWQHVSAVHQHKLIAMRGTLLHPLLPLYFFLLLLEFLNLLRQLLLSILFLVNLAHDMLKVLLS